MTALPLDGPTLAIFVSDRGPGDPERATIMGDVGRVFARRGARLLCLAEAGVIPVPLIAAARAAGGAVEVLADASIVLPPALADVPISVVPDRATRLAQLAQRASAFVALPGSLASAMALFSAWAGGPPRPVVMLNRHRAFEAVRGFAADVLAVSVPGYDRSIQFADTVDDLWAKVTWLEGQRR